MAKKEPKAKPRILLFQQVARFLFFKNCRPSAFFFYLSSQAVTACSNSSRRLRPRSSRAASTRCHSSRLMVSCRASVAGRGFLLGAPGGLPGPRRLPPPPSFFVSMRSSHWQGPGLPGPCCRCYPMIRSSGANSR
nr:MAG TPA: hypothetical protein [Caudoviricetes sp.]